MPQPKKTPHLHSIDALTSRALEAARAQKIIVPGEAPTAELIRDLAASPMSLGPLARHRRPLDARAKIGRIDRDLEGLLTDHPDGALIRSLPGMVEEHQFTEQRACRLVGISRSSLAYQARPGRHARLRERLITLSGKHRRYGYRMLHAKLVREGFRVNVKVVERIYRED